MNDDPVAQLFKSTMQQYSQQIDPETMNYLLRTYQMGQQDVAFSSLVSCLVDAGYNEDQLLQGPLSQLAQALRAQTDWSAEPDPSAIRRTDEHPDPFAEGARPLPQVPVQQQPGGTAANADQQPQPPAGSTGQVISSTPPQQNGDGVLHVH